MSAHKHTPGPWAVRYDYVVQAPAYEDGRLVPVAQPYGVNCDGTDLFANARLSAAAPELLAGYEAIKHSIQQARIHGNDWRRELALIENTVDAAIAKATGEPA